MVRGLYVTRKKRSDPIPDRKPDFPAFDCLHLELMENKKKLKKGLPLIPVIARKPPIIQQTQLPSSKEDYIPSKDTSSHSTTNTSSNTSKISSKTTIDAPSLSSKERRRLERIERKKSKKHSKKHSKKRSHDDSSDEDILFLSDGDVVGDIIGEKSSRKEKYKKSKDDIEEDDEDIEEDDEDIEEDDEDIEEDDGDKEPEEEDEYAGLTPEEREAKEKEEYIWRFRILKKKYKAESADIPDYNEFSDLKTMKISYDRKIKELYLDDSVETYRSYLLGGSMIIEFACTQWMDVDMGGFVIHQTKMMYKYDRLLIELGEKSYNQWGGSLPVEVRLLILVLFQAGIFYLAKVIQTKYGGTMADLFRGMTSQPPPAKINDNTNSSSTKPKGGKMRGPKVRPEDIKIGMENEVEDDE